MVRKQQGFTIVETLVTIVILGAITTGVAAGFLTIQQLQSKTRIYDMAVRAAQLEIESLRNNNYVTLPIGSSSFTSDLPSDLPNNATGTVVVSEPDSGLKRVDVTINYNYLGRDEQVQLSSMIGILGIAR